MPVQFVRLLVPLFILLAVVQLRPAEPAFLQELRNRAFDLFIQSKPRLYQPAPVKIVEID